MDSEKNQLSWFHLGKAPAMPGLYAWYFKPELLDSDIDGLCIKLSNSDDLITDSERDVIVRHFLKAMLYSYFEQKPYLVELKGQLKPRFSGEVGHRADEDLSDELVKRIAKNPERLYALRNLIERTTPLQASPLYIGMADNLRERIARHRKLIIQLENAIVIKSQKYLNIDLSISEVNFAERVVERRIPPTQLFVTYQVSEDKLAANDVENILNRIYFPVLGRN
jgi:hypothetical protein